MLSCGISFSEKNKVYVLITETTESLRHLLMSAFLIDESLYLLQMYLILININKYTERRNQESKLV